MASAQGRPVGFFRRRIGAPLRAVCTQGTSPRKMAEGVVLGALFGVIPVYGTSTAFLTIVAIRRHLNLPAIQAVNWLMAIPQLALWITFMRLGERLFRTPPLALCPHQLIAQIQSNFPQFMGQFGMAVVHALAGWVVLCIPLAWVCHVILAAWLHPARALPGLQS